MHTEWATVQGIEDEFELDNLMEIEQEIEYFDMFLSLVYYVWCFYTAIQTLKRCTDGSQRQKYLRLLYLLLAFTGLDWFVFFMDFLFGSGVASFEVYFTAVQIVQAVYIFLVGIVAWLWRPTENEYDLIPMNEPFNYLQLHESAISS